MTNQEIIAGLAKVAIYIDKSLKRGHEVRPRVTKSHLSEEIMEPKYPPFKLKENQQLFWIGNHSAVLTKLSEPRPAYCFDIQLGYRFQLDEERELVEGGIIPRQSELWRMRKRGQFATR